MKPLLQKLPVTEQTSFVTRTYTTPHFETSWHQHTEYELIVQLKGNGMCFIGNFIGAFKQGEIYLLGSNLPHEFKKEKEDMECSVMVIHFDKNFWGKAFWDMPESREIERLLDRSMLALKLHTHDNDALATAIPQLEQAQGFERITLLCQCLLMLSRDPAIQTLSTIDNKELHLFNDNKINRVFEFTISQFRNPIALSDVASIANMSVSAFCRYFKKNTKKTYVEFVNEMRIGHACQALVNTDDTIVEIGYENGFNTVANFNRQFLKVKGMKPSVYKRTFRNQ